MKYKVVKKQYISEMCFGCGKDNPAGIKAQFYELEDQRVVALFKPGEFFQSYPQRMHGGVSASIMDETLGRAILPIEPDSWAVTAEITIRYKKPAPLDTPLKVVAEVTENSRRVFKARGEMLLPDGTVAVTAQGTYVKQPLSKISDMTKIDSDRVMIEMENDLEYIEF
ncbi:MAG: PaaI family thioesterase [Peptococcaceae bacterium]|nr:PaaI family thioesterase [Peptococcaceae bacterium]